MEEVSPANIDTKVNRPKDSRLRQQKLAAWQPILTAGTVIPCFFIIGLLFLPVGIGLYISSKNVQEYVLDYSVDDCYESKNPDSKKTCAVVLQETPGASCQCKFITPIDEIKGPVYIYYGLTNYYQNHRRYAKSRSDSQLLGDLGSVDTCGPYDSRTDNGSLKKYLPCGATANSMFNDTFKIALVVSGKPEVPVLLTYRGVAWPTDYDHKFKNPDNITFLKSHDYLPPPNWKIPIYELDPENADNNGLQNTELIVWMRNAALPTFRKLWRIVDQDKLKAGNYTITVTYNYPVHSFDGKKKLIISGVSWLGGKNPFLGVAYMVVGSLCIVLGFLFLLLHLKFGKSLTELSSVGTRP